MCLSFYLCMDKTIFSFQRLLIRLFIVSATTISSTIEAPNLSVGLLSEVPYLVHLLLRHHVFDHLPFLLVGLYAVAVFVLYDLSSLNGLVLAENCHLPLGYFECHHLLRGKPAYRYYISVDYAALHAIIVVSRVVWDLGGPLV